MEAAALEVMRKREKDRQAEMKREHDRARAKQKLGMR